MSLKKLLALVTGALGIVAVAAAVCLVVFTNRLSSTASSIRHAIESIRAAEEIRVHLLAHNRESLLLHLQRLQKTRGSPTDNGNPLPHEAALKERIETIRQYLGSAEEEKLFQEANDAIARYLRLQNTNNQRTLVRPADRKKATDALNLAYDRTDLLTQLNIREAREKELSASRESSIANFLGTAVALFTAFTLIGLAAILRRWIFIPISALYDRILGFASGKKSSPLPTTALVEVQSISDAFQDLTERLQNQKESQLRYLASVAHDLRNPIGAIRMAAEVVSEDDLSAKERVTYTDIIVRQAGHLDRLVGDLLDATRIEAGEFDLRRSDQDLSRLVLDAVRLHSPLSSMHKFVLKDPEETVHCNCDPLRVSQVLNNVLNNAIKYSPYGGTIEVELKTTDGRAEIRVIDQGIGISAEDRARIFEPFRRTSVTKVSIPGVGLGLSVSKKIIEGHGGTIEVESEPQKGTVFTILLPLGEALPAMEENGADTVTERSEDIEPSEFHYRSGNSDFDSNQRNLDA